MTHLPVPVEGSRELVDTSRVTAYEAARNFALASKSEGSKRAYAKDWRAFAAWCVERHKDSLPARADTVSAYLADTANQGLSVSSVQRRAAAIAYFHRIGGYEPNDRAPRRHPPRLG
jgi:site-specific recombinase XerD